MNFIPPPSDCPLCPRLVAFRQQNRLTYPCFYNGAVPPFGEESARFLIVGLAPGLKGANATGRPFTGDYAGEILYPALIKAGFAKGEYHGLESRGDAATAKKAGNIQLVNTRVSNAVRCVPPENKPTPQEITTCNQFLTAEIAAMPRLKVILTLGLIAHNAVLKAFGLKVSTFKFTHGGLHRLTNQQSPITNPENLYILNSYHTSRYNLNTGRLTEAMFAEIIEKVRELAG